MNLNGKRVALTGELTGLTRDEFKQRLAEVGATYFPPTALNEMVDVLVTGADPRKSRLGEARKFGVEVVEQATFEAMLNAQMSATDEDVPLAMAEAVVAPPSVEVHDTWVRVCDQAVTLRADSGPLTPAIEAFDHYTLDRPTLEMLRFLARSVALRQPCLLEGETASSKTSAILYLAALTRHEVVRINLNGQTDTSELIGRYIPHDGALPISIDDLRQHPEVLDPKTQHILQRATSQGRPLTPVEAQQIVAIERMRPPAWRFQEGLIPQAMRNGWWVILDEVNLAEPPVLERLNSVLEREPTLVITEGPGTRFGHGGDVTVHPDFRMFATMNPAEYQGRSVLSPAYKDRWVATWQAEAPSEAEYRQMLERVVFGRQPEVEVGGHRFAGVHAPVSPYPELARVPGLSRLLGKLAALHAGLTKMATAIDGKSASIGSSRRERYVFSRRSLHAVIDGLAHATVVNPSTGQKLTFRDAPETIAADAIAHAYVDRIRGDDDRTRVIQVIRSLGLARDGWLHRFADEGPPT